MDPEVLTAALLLAREQAGDDPELAKALLQALAEEHGQVLGGPGYGGVHESKDATGHEHDAKGRFGSGGGGASSKPAKASVLHADAMEPHVDEAKDVMKTLRDRMLERTDTEQFIEDNDFVKSMEPGKLPEPSAHSRGKVGDMIGKSIDTLDSHVREDARRSGDMVDEVLDKLRPVLTEESHDALTARANKVIDRLTAVASKVEKAKDRVEKAVEAWQQAGEKGKPTAEKWRAVEEAFAGMRAEASSLRYARTAYHAEKFHDLALALTKRASREMRQEIEKE